ncbi:acetate--CoA ligase family protein [Gracilibacillus sp. Marseille-QA3620]
MREEKKSIETLEPLFNAKSVAILGASENPYKIGHIQLKALIDGKFGGAIYPINPKADAIAGLPCYSSISEISAPIDVAILCVGANQIQDSLTQCGKKGVKAAIIFASGFSEVGGEGEEAQRALAEVAKENGIRVIGPNCVGLVNTMNGFIGTFSPAILAVPFHEERAVGYVSQSGAYGVLTYMAAAQNGLTFNYFVSVGNEMDVEFSDVVEYMIHDDKTKVITGYLEGEKNPDKLRALAKEALERKKPIVLMKTGRSEAGSRAASSHTGSLAGSDAIYDAFFKQTGIVRVDDYEDIITFSKLFLSNKLPKGKNTVIITSSGGRGINEADRSESFGLKVIPLGDKTQTEIKRVIPNYGSASNPIDLTAAASVTNPELFIAPLKALVEDPEVHNIILTEFPLGWDSDNQFLQEFIQICKNSDKFVLVTTFPLEGMSIPKGTKALEENGIPVIPGNLNPVKGLSYLVAYSEYVQKHEDRKLLEEAAPQPVSVVSASFQTGSQLSESAAAEILQAQGIATPKRWVAKTEEEAVSYANEIGYPVVLKVDSPDIPHKTEANGICLNLQNEQEVREAFKSIEHHSFMYKPDARINGISVQEMLPEGIEVIIGSTKDSVFGPVIMFGLGGIFVEVFQDVSFRVAPLTRADALEMVKEIKGYAILDGARGKARMNIDAIIDTLLKVSALVTSEAAGIKELDINPLMVYPDGVKAADAMIVLSEDSKEKTVIKG